MKHRIFTAISISSSLQGQILAWGKSRSELPVRWLNGKNLHITLTPPFYTEDVKDIQLKLRAINKKFKPLVVKFEKISYGPNLNSPRLIWLQGKAPETIISLKTELEKILKRQPENRPFLLHLTIARFREKDFYNFPIKELEETINWQETVNSFVLMESHLSPKGADYEILDKIPILGEGF